MMFSIRYFLESKSVEDNRLFVLVYANKDHNSNRFKAKRYYLPKVIIKNLMWSSIEKTFMIKQSIQI